MGLVTKINSTHLILGGVAIAAVIYFADKAIDKAEDVAQSINPVNDDNIINQGVSKVVNDLTDGRHKNLGSWLYCKVNPDAYSCRDEPFNIKESL